MSMDLFGRGLPRFAVAVEDPAWGTESGGGGRGADEHYPLMTIDDIVALKIRDCLAHDVHYWLWCTDSVLLNHAPRVLSARGVRHVATWIWVKTKGEHDEPEEAEDDVQIGLGQYSRKSHEYLLLATRGHAAVPYAHNRPASVFFAPRGRHSAKPEAAWEVIEKVSRPGPRVEFNCRTPRPNWTGVGHGVGVTIEDFCAEYRR